MLTLVLPIVLVTSSGLLGFCLLRAAGAKDAPQRDLPRRRPRGGVGDTAVTGSGPTPLPDPVRRTGPYDWAADESASAGAYGETVAYAVAKELW